MKLFKKIAAIMLSIMMVLGMASVVSAEGTGATAATGTGKITITNAIPKQTYKIYRILELESYNKATGSYAYKATSAWKTFIESNEIQDVYVTINNDYVTWKEGANAADFAKTALAYAKDPSNGINNNGFQEVAEESSSVTFDNLDLGYYLVESSVGALCGLTTTNNEVTIQEKNGVPSVDKKVQEDSTSAWGESNTADIGQTVNFQTTIKAQAGAQNYVLHDKMNTGLTFDVSSVRVKLKKNGEATESAVDTFNYVVKTSELENPNPCTFHVEFQKAFCDTLAADDQIIVTYSATLNEKAVIAGNGNVNETWLKYGESSETTHDTTTTKTYSIPVFKYTGNSTPLENAEFELKRKDDTTAIALIKKNSGADSTYTGDIYRVAKSGETGTVTKVITPNTGKFKIEGLDAGTYYLTETKQPAGYNKLKDPVTVVISEEGNITVGTSTTHIAEVEVENKTGSILPSTGGSGTTLIYILGAVLVLGSGVALITRKRMR